VKPFGPLHA
jgi:hypothetical protein